MFAPVKHSLMPENVASAQRSSWSAEGSALVADALRRSGHLRLQVHGESMLPALWPGDVVEIASCSLADVRPGEIVLARREGRLFLHRFVAPCTPDGFLLRGDSMPNPDPLFPSEALLGRLARMKGEVDRGHESFERKLHLARNLGRLGSGRQGYHVQKEGMVRQQHGFLSGGGGELEILQEAHGGADWDEAPVSTISLFSRISSRAKG